MASQHELSQRLYDPRAQTYDDSSHPSMAKQLSEIAEFRPGEQVLDLACGTGLVTFIAAASVGKDGHVIGVDVSSGMLEQARSKVNAHSVSNVDIYQHDISHLESLKAIQGQTFDVITVASALVLLDDPSSAIKQWIGFLKPRGRLVLDALSPSTFTHGLVFERTARRLGLKTPYNRDWVKSSDSLKHILEAAGLVVSRMESVAQTGESTKFIRVGDAEVQFEKHVDGEAFAALAKENIKEKARAVFKEEWEKIAVDGKVKFEDCIWVAVGRRVV